MCKDDIRLQFIYATKVELMRNAVTAQATCSNMIRTKFPRNSVLYTNMLHNCGQWKMLRIIFYKKNWNIKKEKKKHCPLHCCTIPQIHFPPDNAESQTEAAEWPWSVSGDNVDNDAEIFTSFFSHLCIFLTTKYEFAAFKVNTNLSSVVIKVILSFVNNFKSKEYHNTFAQS